MARPATSIVGALAAALASALRRRRARRSVAVIARRVRADAARKGHEAREAQRIEAMRRNREQLTASMEQSA